MLEVLKRLEALEAENRELKVKVAKLEMDNEELWERFSDLLSEYDYYHQFRFKEIEVFDEW